MSEAILRDRSARQNVPVPYRAAESLRIIPPSKGPGGTRMYVMQTRNGGLQLGEEEYFIFTLLDSRPTFAEIEHEFRARFAAALSRPQFQALMDDLLAAGVIERIDETPAMETDEADAESAPPSRVARHRRAERPVRPRNATESATPARTQHVAEPASAAVPEGISQEGISQEGISQGISLLPLFLLLARLGAPLRFFLWPMIPATAVAGFALFAAENRVIATLTALDWRNSRIALSGLSAVLAVLLIPRLAEGATAAFHGAPRETFRLRLSGGFLPRFPIDRDLVAALPRKARVWSLAAPLLTWLALFVIGASLWASYDDAGNPLALTSLLTGELGLWSFLVNAIPLLPGAGKRWLEAYCDEPDLERTPGHG